MRARLVVASEPESRADSTILGAKEEPIVISDDESDDDIQFVTAAGPSSGTVLARARDAGLSITTRTEHPTTTSIRLRLARKREEEEVKREDEVKRRRLTVPTQKPIPLAIRKRNPIPTLNVKPEEIASPPLDVKDEYTFHFTTPSPPPPPRHAPGARPIDPILIYSAPTLVVNFDPAEIPSFERGAWLRLCTHRYLLSSTPAPRNSDEERYRADELKLRLLSLFRLSSWPPREEPRISFPRLPKVSHKFVDIHFVTRSQHDATRHRSPLLRMGNDVLLPFVHGAFIEPCLVVVQFSHPTMRKEGDERLEEKEKEHLRVFGAAARVAVAESALGQAGEVVAMWLLEDGYPHNPELENGLGLERRPEYTMLLRRGTKQVRIPPWLKIVDRPRKRASEGEEKSWDGYVKLWWDERPADLCNYCKDAADGHSDKQCTRGNSEERARRELKPRPTVY
ncbi:hypothetical protein PSEUBRA_006238 [Kalmanozyma brasiliensis GHG001]|uniref:uncharacterized protein n=1 Tax=Kalmanozyma brasiliensis (strain GHG001) TaxID=1365824 RepID=UPI002867F72E|nr:uncharacterized protein PSEUBRA_006238 [Kalmanozyma brasiliensis GHG001]KAF6767647.1 hypothetical protein PSEUBRA_006238 [Kalmanozyma brasiliensis GHG001]